MFQLGFRTNYSTECCLACLTEFTLTGMDKQTHIGMVLVNIQKRFDNLDHGVFWKKQNNLVFGHQELNALSLTSQTDGFWFLLRMSVSEDGALKYKVAEGCNLEYLLFSSFSLNVNDFHQLLSEARSYL